MQAVNRSRGRKQRFKQVPHCEAAVRRNSTTNLSQAKAGAM
jgi:hypothetical protein